MPTTLEELTALREQMTVAGLSTAEIDSKIDALKGEIAIENDYPVILESVQEFIEPIVHKWANKNVNLSFRFDSKGLSFAISELDGANKIFYQREDIPELRVMPVISGTARGRASVRLGSAVLLFREWPRQRTSHEGVKPRAGKAIAAAGGGRDEGDSKC
jgi:hypothetical protein